MAIVLTIEYRYIINDYHYLYTYWKTSRLKIAIAVLLYEEIMIKQLNNFKRNNLFYVWYSEIKNKMAICRLSFMIIIILFKSDKSDMVGRYL